MIFADGPVTLSLQKMTSWKAWGEIEIGGRARRVLLLLSWTLTPLAEIDGKADGQLFSERPTDADGRTGKKTNILLRCIRRKSILVVAITTMPIWNFYANVFVFKCRLGLC